MKKKLENFAPSGHTEMDTQYEYFEKNKTNRFDAKNVCFSQAKKEHEEK